MYEVSIGADKIVLTDEQLDVWEETERKAPQIVPPHIRAAIKFRRDNGGGNAGVIIQPNGTYRLDQPAAVSRVSVPVTPTVTPRPMALMQPPPQPFGVSDGNNAVWYHTFSGTSTLSLQTVQPNDPISISDLAWDTDDSTARLQLIKQGSTELFAGSGSGVLITSLRDDQKFRGLFAGRIVTRERPLLVTVVHAGSGSPTSTVRIIGYKGTNDASACGA